MLKLHKISKYNFLIFFAFIAYAFIWSFISLMRYYSLQAGVFDLGFKMQLGWYSLYHPYFGLFTDISHLIVYFAFPFFIFKNFPSLLIFQSFFIGMAVFPIYFITKIRTGNPKLSIIVGIIYLLFPLDIGLNWYDFHFMMFFPTLFLFGYLFFLEKKYKFSLFFFILSGLTTYPFLGFSLLFSAVFLIERFYPGKNSNNRFSWDKENKFLLLLMVISFGIMVVQFHIIGINSNMLSKNPSTPVTFFADLNGKILSIIFIFIIGGFSAILKPKWLVFLVPYFFLVFYSTNYVFQYPQIMQFQYAPLVTPFIFMSIADMLHISQDRKHSTKVLGQTSLLYRKSKVFHIIAVVFLLVVVISSTFFFNPLSPLNKESPINFGFYQKDIPNFTVYNGLEELVSLVPSNNPYFMVQQNMPEAYPRPFYQNVGILSVGGGGIAYNASDNNFYVYNTIKGWEPADIQYVLYDPLSQWVQIGGSSIAAVVPGSNSTYQNMYNMFFELLASKEYGILGEANGMVLLERGYFGPLKYFEPFRDNFHISNNNIANALPGLWHGSVYTFVSPGSYKINLKYYITRNYTGSISFSTTGNAGEVQILNVTKNVSYTANTFGSLSFNFTENFPYLYVSFNYPSNSRYFQLLSVHLDQVSPPSNTYYEDM